MQSTPGPTQDDCDSDTDTEISVLDNSSSPEPSDTQQDIALQSAEAEITPASAIVEPEQKTVLQPMPQLSDTPAPEISISAIPDRAPGQPSKNSENRIVKIETAEDLMAEIHWCLSNGGHFELVRSFVPPQKVGYFLEHRDYNYGERQVKTALARELIERQAIRSDSPATGTREFYIWDDRAFPTAELSDSQSDTALQLPEPETPSESAIVEPEQDTALQSALQLSDKPRPYRVGQGMVSKDFVEPGQEPQLSGNRIVEISAADDLLAEIRWCIDNGGDFVFLFDRGKSGNGTPRRTYYLRHECYWEGMRPVKTALVRELIERRAIWTNDPAKGPGSGCRRFYPASTKAEPKFPTWMTAKEAFRALGGNPDDRDSSVSSVDGLKQIKFSTFKKKTSSELKSFGLELNQDRKRRRQPCYRLLKPNPKL